MMYSVVPDSFIGAGGSMSYTAQRMYMRDLLYTDSHSCPSIHVLELEVRFSGWGSLPWSGITPAWELDVTVPMFPL